MKPARPTCDCHTNLQMVPCWVKRRGAVVAAYACPVPGCTRFRTHEGYLNAADLEVVLEPSAGRKKAVASARQVKVAKKSAPSSQERPLNRHTAARAAILKAIESKRDS